MLNIGTLKYLLWVKCENWKYWTENKQKNRYLTDWKTEWNSWVKYDSIKCFKSVLVWSIHELSQP